MSVAAVAGLGVEIGDAAVVSHIDVCVGPGERVGLLGASGSGKSMTARALLGQLPSQARATGSVIVNGHEVLGTPMVRRPQEARVAHIAQDSATALNPLVRIDVQICHPLIRRGLSASDAGAEAVSLLESVGLPTPDEFLHRYPGQLSGGQRQRVCIALALACRCPLLVADEPTTALDVVSQRRAIDTLLAYTSRRDNEDEPRTGLLFITHDLAVAAQVCERAIVLVNGRVVESKSMPDLLSAPDHPYTRSLVAIARATQLPDLVPDISLAEPVGAGSWSELRS